MRVGKLIADAAVLASMILACAIVLPATAVGSTDDASVLRQQLRACLALIDGAERVTCYDQLARESLTASPVQQTGNVTPRAAEAATIPAQASALPSVPAAEHEADVFSFFERGDNKLVVRIASVGVNSDYKLRIVTTEDVILDQTDDKRIRNKPKAGDELIITSGAFGGKWCRLNDRDLYACKPKRK